MTDFEIPTRYGLRQTIADTIGIGGIMRGLRTIPVMIEMATRWPSCAPTGSCSTTRTRWRWCPGGSGRARACPRRARSACATASATPTRSWPRPSGCREERVEFRTAGFNHQCFVYVFRDRETGDDLYPRLREIVEADPEGLGRRVRVELFKRFGYFPTESSEHSSEYVPWFLHHDDQVARFRIEIDEYIRR